MRARIQKQGSMFYGEVYGIWESILGERTGWKRVTPLCFSRRGVEWELKKWKQENLPEEIVI